MTQQVTLLVLGFVLTTVIGGGLGYLFQARAWRHQHDIQQRDGERGQALKTFEEVSTLLDKRLYRMRRLYWAASQKSRGAGDEKQWEDARADYRGALYEWNDNMNRILALTRTYFGGAVRQELEDGIYEEFATLGRALNDIVRMVSHPDDAPIPLSRFGHRLTGLSNRVYQLNVRMLQLLEGGLLGNRAPQEDPDGAGLRTGDPLLELGAHGGAVRRLQRSLQSAGQKDVPVDGQFGPQTYRAVRSLQASRNLDVDGIVGPSTWASLPES